MFKKVLIIILHHVNINSAYCTYYTLNINSNLLQVNWMVVELKGSAVKERHWKSLMRKLRVAWVLSDLNLGQVTLECCEVQVIMYCVCRFGMLICFEMSR